MNNWTIEQLKLEQLNIWTIEHLNIWTPKGWYFCNGHNRILPEPRRGDIMLRIASESAPAYWQAGSQWRRVELICAKGNVPLNNWTTEHLNIWTIEHLNIWTIEHLNIWTPKGWYFCNGHKHILPEPRRGEIMSTSSDFQLPWGKYISYNITPSGFLLLCVSTIIIMTPLRGCFPIQ
jgi:hypothetical protein